MSVATFSRVPVRSFQTSANPPSVGGAWERGDNGRYTIYIRPNQVTDNRGTTVPPGIIGAFTVRLRKGHHTTTTAAAVTRALTPPLTTLFHPPHQKRRPGDVARSDA